MMAPDDAAEFDPFAGGELESVIPTSEAQREVWLADRLGVEASLAFNESIRLVLRGSLQVDALRRAIEGLVARHGSLRATISPDGTELLVGTGGAVDMPVIDLRSGAPAERDAVLAAALDEAVRTPFALEAGPLLRTTVYVLAEDEHLLLMTAHHVICDGWSWGVIVTDLGALYGELLGLSPAPDAAPAYADYVAWEQAESSAPSMAEHERYWLARFAGAEAPVLDLPTDRPRRAVRGFASKRIDHAVGQELLAAVRQLGSRAGLSLFVTLFSGFAATLGRLSAQDDVVVGVPAAGQAASGMTGLVGHCVNLLPLRVAVDPSLPFERFARETSSTLLDAFEHQTLTYGSLLRKLAIRRDASRMPLVSVMFNLDQDLHLDPGAFGGLEVSLASNPRRYENFELFVNAVPAAGGLRLECQYNSDLFDAQTVRGWLRLYEQLLAAAVREPQVPLGALDWLSVADRSALQALQPTARPVPAGLMHSAFAAQAARGPARIALRDAARHVSYRDLDAASNALAHRLRARGIGRGDRVGLCLGRSVDMVAALLAVLKAGAAYVPLDPGFPAARLAFYAEDARLALLITEPSIGAAPRAWCADAASRILELDADTDWGAVDPGPLPTGPGDARADDAAYVIYTSGSTGRPKGVCVPHRAVVNFLDSMAREPGIGPDDRLAAVTTLSFDIAVLELLLPLSVGAEVVLVSRDAAIDGPHLGRLLQACNATMMQATPGLWRMLLDTPWRGGPRFKALIGGESCPPELARALCERVGALWNMYGPTETTVWSTCWRVDPVDPVVSIGRPIANTEVWVLDDRRAACPIGVPGEICIGGAGLAIGYLDRPELDADRFVADPHDPSGQRRLYRTGDRGRWRHDGLLEHLGRLDFQVKLRGYRIELGEIEAVASAQPGIGRSVAVVREDDPGDPRLVLYMTRMPGRTPSEDDVVDGLRASLPEYMLPQHLVWLDALPVLPNGKIDRRSLPRPAALGTVAANERVGPRDETERQVLAVMEEVLKLPGLGVHDNFFSMGGHSLLAARLVARLSEAVSVAVPLRAVFEAPTAERLARLVAHAGSDGSDGGWQAIRHDPTQTRAPLSLMQQRVWFLERLNPGRLTYNTPSAHRLRGPMDPKALECALKEVVRRQPILRTRFGEVDGVPYQQVLDDVGVALGPLEDLSALAAAGREAELMRRMQALVDEPFDLSRPLWRARLYRLGEQDHVLFFMPHHLVWDGWSFDLFYDEMAALYAGFEAGVTPTLAPLPLTYGDFARWQRDWLRGAELERQVAPWRASLKPLPEPLDLPLDRARPAQTSGAGATEWIHLPLSAAEAVRRLARQHEATPFMVLLAVFALLLQRLSAQTDLVVGTPVRGRSAESVEKLMGFFVNVLPLRLGVDPRSSFEAVLGDVRRRVLTAFSHADVPFEELVHALDPPRDPSRSALYQAFFSYQDARERQRRWGRLAHEQIHLFQRGAAEDVGLWLLEHPQGLSGGFTYSTDLFDPASARGFADGFQRLLESAMAAPTLPVGLLDAVTAADRERLQAWNQRQVERHAPMTVGLLLAQAFQRYGQDIALVAGDVTLTYAALGVRVRRLANHLRDRGAARGTRIGLLLERGADMLVAQLAILETGAAYVPLDPAFPEDRLAYMQDDAGLALLVTSPALEHLAKVAPPRRVRLGAANGVDVMAASEAHPGDAAIDGDAGPDDPAYVIYTSGSTGRPKGVVVPHRAVVNFLLSMAREPGLEADDRLVAVTTLSFDIAVLELLLPLSVGARVVMAVGDAVGDGHRLRRLVEAEDATVLQATPSTWRLLIDAGWQGTPRFKALVGGEPLPADLAIALRSRSGELWNLYGPTETTVWSTCWRVEHPEAGISIGRPIDNTRVWVLDEHLQPCPPGVPGELCIGGAGVALGYLDRPDLTTERFIDDPLMPGARLYRTGDRGRWRRDGLLEHMGRLDFQVKVRGYRIELGEIEAVLATHASVSQAVVTVHRRADDDVRLVAYVVPAAGASVDPIALRVHLRQRLPDYMLPQHMVEIGTMPLLPNGKIDRKALAVPDAPAPAPIAPPAAPSSDRERLMWQIWRELLGHDRFGVGDDFFDVGGHSMLSLRLMSMIEQRFGRRLPLSVLLQASTVRSLTAWMEVQQAAHSPVEIRAGADDEPALFLVHDGDGETLLYRGLAQRLRPGLRVYGLPPLSKTGCALAHTRLREMAAYHVQRMRTVQAHGPYLIGGLCAGGVIAYEVARQLREAGEDVPLVALLDIADIEATVRTSFVHGRRLKRFVAALQNDDGASMGSHLSRSLQRASRKVRNFLVYSQESRAQRNDTERRAELLERALDRGEPPPAEAAGLTVRQIYFFARDRYVPPGPLDGDVLLVRATAGDGSQGDIPCVEMYSDPLFDWGRRVAGQVRVVDVPGGHSTMLQEPHVDTLATVLQREIDNVLAGSRPVPGAAENVRTGDPSAFAEAAS